MSPGSASGTSVGQRVLWWAIAASGLAVLVAAVIVEPDPRGYGTHTQLGLPPCGFLAVTGFPCPGCGLTTAFAYGMRGDWSLAATSNPLGLLLFVVVCLSVPLSMVAALRGWSFEAIVDRFSLNRWALALAGCAIVVWAVRFGAAL